MNCSNLLKTRWYRTSHILDRGTVPNMAHQLARDEVECQYIRLWYSTQCYSLPCELAWIKTPQCRPCHSVVSVFQLFIEACGKIMLYWRYPSSEPTGSSFLNYPPPAQQSPISPHFAHDSFRILGTKVKTIQPRFERSRLLAPRMFFTMQLLN